MNENYFKIELNKDITLQKAEDGRQLHGQLISDEFTSTGSGEAHDGDYFER